MKNKSDNFKIIIVGIITSLIAFLFTFNYEVEKEKLQFSSSANDILNKIEYIFSTVERANSELSSRFYLLDEISKDDFKFFTSSLIKQNDFIQSILFAKNIKKEEQKKYELSRQYSGYTGFKIKPFPNSTLSQQSSDSFLLPIEYIEPYTVKNSRYFGLDLYTHPIFPTSLASLTPNNLIYRKDKRNKNAFFAINLLYRGYASALQNKKPSDLYGALSYKIDLENIEHNLKSLSIKTKDHIILKKEDNAEILFEIMSQFSKTINLDSQNIFIELKQSKSLFAVDMTYPIVVLLLSLLLTGLISHIIHSHEKINLLLKKQKSVIELEVEYKTEELRKKADELEAFSYSVSHDLRAPLHSIDGFSELLQVSYYDILDEQAKDYIENINNASKKMSKIINSLLTLSQISRSEIQVNKCNISELAERSVDTIRDYEPGKIINIKIEQDVYAYVDAAFIEICFDNLFSNAWKYSSTVDKPSIEFGTIQRNNEIIYYIKDNGAGFDMQDSNKLFIPFQRLHHNSEFEGIGIGLMTVQRIILKHHGRIWAESMPGKGATFFFTFNTD